MSETETITFQQQKHVNNTQCFLSRQQQAIFEPFKYILVHIDTKTQKKRQTSSQE